MADSRVILYDAHCRFCSASVAFVRRWWAGGTVRYLPLDSPEGRDLADRFCGHARPDTMLVIDGDSCFDRSTGVLQVAGCLAWPWRWLAVLAFIPVAWRDAAYDWVARNRGRFGCSHQHASSCRSQNLRLCDRAGIGYH